MHRPWFLFSLLVAMCLVVGALFFLEGRPYRNNHEGGAVQRAYQGQGSQHSVYATMEQAGDDPGRHGNMLWLGWILATLQVVFAVSCLALGMTRKENTGPARRPLFAGALLFVLIFTAMIVSYHGYMSDGTRSLVLGLPVPTAWMLYGVWAFPLFFVLFFFLNFNRWYVKPTDLERLYRLVAQRKSIEREQG